MTLRKSQIVDEIHERALGFNYSRKKSVETVEIVLEIIKRTLENGEDVLISGFGKFCVREKKERRGRNPATGESLMLPGLADIHAEFQKLTVDSRCAPEPILSAHTLDKTSDLRLNGRTSRPTPPTFSY